MRIESRAKLFLVLALLAILLHVCPVSGQERLTIEPPPHRWKPLRKEVLGVTIGPDQRIWYQLWTQSVVEQWDDVRLRLEREWKEPAPQIYGAELAHLDADGRAWFYFDNRTRLRGYDGKRWIEPACEVVGPFRGFCPTAGRLSSGYPENTDAGGRVFFFDQTGIISFDGDEWLRLTLPDDERKPYPLLFSVSPNGKWAVAISRKSEGLAVLHDGKWQQRSEKFEIAQAMGSIEVTDAGVVWYVSPGKSLTSVSLDPDYKPSPQLAPEPMPMDRGARIAELVRLLDDDSFATRNEAQAKLTAMGSAVLPDVERALSEATSEEMKERLRLVIAELKPLPRVAQSTNPDRKEVRFAFGGYQLRTPTSLFQDKRGRLYVAAQAIADSTGTELGRGVVVVSPTGGGAVITRPDVVTALQHQLGAYSNPILTPSGDQLWVSRMSSGLGPFLLDLRSLEIIREIAEGEYMYMRGVDGDGRLYLARHAASSVPGMRVMVHSPEAEDDRIPLDVSSMPIDPSGELIASDGSIWVSRRGEGIYRFAGKGWHKVEDRLEFPRLFAAGVNGEVLAENRTLSLWRGDEQIASSDHKDIQKFVRENRAAIAEAFDARKIAPTHLRRHTSLVADAAGHIWLHRNSQVDVLVNDEWIAVKEFLKVAGSRNGDTRFVVPLGDGSQVYLSDTRLLHDGGKSFIGQVKDGVPSFKLAPHANYNYQASGPLREADGDLWVSGYLAKASGTSDTIFGTFAARLNEKGPVEQVQNVGEPAAVDAAGNVWFLKRPPRNSGLLIVYRDKEQQEVDIPDADAVHCVFSDRPGSVFALSSRGLEHLVADDPKSLAYKHRATYAVSGISRNIQFAGYSSLGYLAVSGPGGHPVPGHQLLLVQLPKLP